MKSPVTVRQSGELKNGEVDRLIDGEADRTGGRTLRWRDRSADGLTNRGIDWWTFR